MLYRNLKIYIVLILIVIFFKVFHSQNHDVALEKRNQ